MIRVRRVYALSAADKGRRFLVDRVWPRGVKKEALQPFTWAKEAAPSTALRRWFGHDPARWEEFRRRYWAELDERPEAVQAIRDAAREGDVLLLYSAKDEERNQAVALQAYLDPSRDDGNSA